MDEQRDELKPCPFCGSEDIFVDEKSIFVICRNCNTQVWGMMDNELDVVVSLWNTRPEPPTAGDDEAYEKALEALRSDSAKYAYTKYDVFEKGWNAALSHRPAPAEVEKGGLIAPKGIAVDADVYARFHETAEEEEARLAKHAPAPDQMREALEEIAVHCIAVDLVHTADEALKVIYDISIPFAEAIALQSTEPVKDEGWQEWPSDYDVSLALKMSRYVHDHCENAPHDIGVHLAAMVWEKYGDGTGRLSQPKPGGAE